MNKKTQLLAVGILFLLLLPVCSWSASFNLTSTQFKNRGFGAFIGNIMQVDVQSTDESTESGTIQLKVVQVVAGTATATTVTLPFTRALQPTDEPSNWDTIEPLYVSLSKLPTGRSFLIYFTGSNGQYSLAPAGNSVQDATSGLLTGTINLAASQQSSQGDGCRQVQVEISEVIYGWAGVSSTVSLCVDSRSFAPSSVLGGWSGNSPTAPDPHGGSDANNSAVGCPPEYLNKKLLVAFENNRIVGVQIASDKLLADLQTSDAQ